MNLSTSNKFEPVALPEPPFHAWYSSLAAAFLGSGIWRHEDGREIEITLAHEDRTMGERHYSWTDRVYLGRVTERLRQGRTATYAPGTVYCPHLPS